MGPWSMLPVKYHPAHTKVENHFGVLGSCTGLLRPSPSFLLLLHLHHLPQSMYVCHLQNLADWPFLFCLCCLHPLIQSAS